MISKGNLQTMAKNFNSNPVIKGKATATNPINRKFVENNQKESERGTESAIQSQSMAD